jgi:shikimate kinase/3-dehydroquinate synthase
MDNLQGNIYLTGFMGSGKSAVGQTLAKLLKRRFVDLDERIVNRLGMPISQAFTELGEEAFRRAETSELRKQTHNQRRIVGTGGGLPVNPKNRELMKQSGMIVHLAADLETCRQRLGADEVAKRPLWGDAKAVEALWRDRQEAYADCALKVESGGQDVEAICHRIGELLFPQKTTMVSLGGVDSPVIEAWRGEELLSKYTEGRKVVLVTDRNVSRLHLKRYQEALGNPLTVTMAPGDRSKTFKGARPIYQAMYTARMGRGDLLVGLGGGMVTDLAAWVAGTYMRGIEFVLVSTSLVGCVDAAVGGKAAVNLGRVKNLVGLFTLPQAVILDLLSLGTLPRKQIAEGLVEAYKTGLVYAPELFELIDQNMNPLLRGDLPLVAEVARLSAQAKAHVVSQDFREGGIRRILNLGHTYGHALEGYNNFKFSHGQSVAAGLLVAAAICVERGYIDEALYERIQQTMARLLPKKLVWPPMEDAWNIMLGDKKNQGGKVIYVLIKDVGDSLVVDDVERGQVERAVARVRSEL